LRNILNIPKGDPREPMTMEDLQNKFSALSSDLISKDRQDELENIIFECEEYSAKEFMKEMVV
jgi:2-methylcitrate dehydratase